MSATPTDPNAEIVITLNGTEIENGSSATWVAGRNELKIVVNGNEETAYTVIVTAYNDSPIDVDIAGKSFSIGTPVLSDSGLNAALANHALPTMAIQFADNDMEYNGNICPIVSDVSDNIFTDAGITVSEDDSIVAQVDDSYAIWIEFTNEGIDAINPTKIIQVDSSHISVPSIGIFVFDSVSGTINSEPVSLISGWNIFRVTIDTSTYDVTDMSIEPGVEINDYLNIVPDDGNTMTINGVGGLELYDGVIVITP